MGGTSGFRIDVWGPADFARGASGAGGRITSS
jgi:hypothetical protein